jgi:hypothetical protein
MTGFGCGHLGWVSGSQRRRLSLLEGREGENILLQADATTIRTAFNQGGDLSH